MWGVGRQCFETSSFVRANSRGLVTGGRRLPDDGGISLERDGLRTHQPNQSWQNWHLWACLHCIFFSCLLATFTFFIPKYTKWFPRSQTHFSNSVDPLVGKYVAASLHNFWAFLTFTRLHTPHIVPRVAIFISSAFQRAPKKGPLVAPPIERHKNPQSHLFCDLQIFESTTPSLSHSPHIVFTEDQIMDFVACVMPRQETLRVSYGSVSAIRTPAVLAP